MNMHYLHRRSLGKFLILGLSCSSCGRSEKEFQALEAKNAQLAGENGELHAQIEEFEHGAQRLLAKAKVAIDARRFIEARGFLVDLQTRHPGTTESADGLVLLEVVKRGISDAEKAAQEQSARALADQKKADEEKLEKIADATRNMSKEVDEIEGITFYTDKSTVSYRTGVWLYCAQSKDNVWLRWKVQYKDSDWLFIDSFIVVADGIRFDYENATFQRHSSTSVREWRDELVTEKDIPMIKAVMAAKSVTIRLSGSQFRKDIEITEEEKTAMRNVVAVYESLSRRHF